jgi:hypothetical protein
VSISPFFLSLRNGYQAEIDDLTFDSDGQNILQQRLTERRKELGFLLQMLELSPEMVAVVLHQGFRFKVPSAMDHLLSHESEDLPEWDTLSDVVGLTPWAQDLATSILKQPMGSWFMSVAAGLEYMFAKIEHRPHAEHDEDENEGEGNQDFDEFDSEEEKAARAREEAGADWMVEQGFDRKD